MIDPIEVRNYLKSLTVLFVEDEVDALKQLRVFLSRLVGLLVTAQNGAEGLEAWREYKPDIIITDIQMPVMDGLTMLEEIRSVDTEVPVIIQSAFEDSAYLKRSIDLGVDGYLFKPINAPRFAELLMKCARGLMTEAALRENLNLLGGIINGIPDVIFNKDITGQYKLFNSAAEKFVGKSADDVLDKDDHALFPAGVADQLMDIDRRVMEGGVPITYKDVLTNADGLQVSLLITKGPLFDSAGKLIGLFGISRDVSEIKRLETALIPSRENPGI